MPLSTVEGVVENGQIRLGKGVALPEHAKVYVVIPDFDAAPRTQVLSPRLADPSQAADFVKQVVEVSADADI